MAATATRPNDSPQTNSSMSSPKDSKRSIAAAKPEEPTKAEIPSQEPAPSAPTDAEATDAKPVTTTAATSNAQPLAPPPRPAPATTSDTPDYFNTNHNPFSLEPNVFEQSFGNPAVETPGKTILPPVANITSPNPLPGITPGWQSLRSGPLSPAMLSGPTGQGDYFSEGFRGFPTPNESSLRTGLTPGGGGSMFPAPSPNTQALFQSFNSTGVTPGTADFQQSALRAAAANASKTQFPVTTVPASQPEAATATSMDRQNNFPSQQPQSQPQLQQPIKAETYQQDDNTAASHLLSFATQNNGARPQNQSFVMPNQGQQMTNGNHMPVQPVSQDTTRRNTRTSINSMTGSADTGDFSDSGESEQTKTSARPRGKKAAANGKAGTKRKADDTPKNSKKAKSNNGAMPMEEDFDDEDMNMTSPKNEDGTSRKMTDEEKRKNFLERNRVAALKCRQRKKQWLANLQAKVELFSTENDALSATVTQLREEIVNLKTLLLAHKDCPVSSAQGLGGVNMNAFLGGDMAHHQHPYGMGNGMMGMPPGHNR